MLLHAAAVGRDGAAGAARGGFRRPVAMQQGDGLSRTEILVQGGYRTDIQGPQEARWGYTAPQVCDWNGDGLPDLVSSDNSALIKVYLRYRTVEGDLALRPAVPLRLDGLVLHGTWRNGPALASSAANVGGGLAMPGRVTHHFSVGVFRLRLR